MKIAIRILCLLFAAWISIACGGGWFNEFRSIFYPESAAVSSDLSGLHYSQISTWYQPYYEIEDSYKNKDLLSESDLMVKAWRNHTHFVLSEEEISNCLFNGEKHLGEYLDRFKMSEEKTYLEKVNKLNLLTKYDPYNWEGAKERDTIAIKKMLDVFKGDSNDTKNSWLKPRYIYQIMRCLFHLKEYKELQLIFLYHKSDLEKESLLLNMCEGLIAGSFYRSGDQAQAFYKFSKIFAKEDLQSYEAAKNVKVYQIPFSANVLGFCVNDEEKAMVHTLACMNEHEDIPTHLKSIIKYSPKNRFLPLVVSRMINKFENYHIIDTVRYFEGEFDNTESFNVNKKDYSIELDTMISIISVLLSVNNDPFYLLAKAYLLYARGEYGSARMCLSIIPVRSGNLFVEKQRSALEVLCQLKMETKLEEKAEFEILAHIAALKKNVQYDRDHHILKVISNNLAAYYKNDVSKNLIAKSLNDIKYNWHRGAETLEHCETPELEILLKYFDHSKNGNDSLFQNIAQFDKDNIIIALGRRYLFEMKWKEAKEVLRKIPVLLRDQFETEDAMFMPILFFKSKPDISYIVNALQYLDILIEQQDKVKREPTNAGALYDLALSQYNLTYFGNASSFVKKSRSTEEVPQDMIPANDVKKYYFCEDAMRTLEQCIKYAKGDEKVKAVYLAALIENHQFDMKMKQDFPDDFYYDYEFKFSLGNGDAEQIAKMLKIKRAQFSKYTHYFKNELPRSKYKSMIIQECDYLK